MASIGWARRGGAQAGLVLLLALGALRQAAVLAAGVPDGLLDVPQAVGEGALLLASIAGLVTARAFRRTVEERNRAEDLHWDSMEAVRALSELAGRPGAHFEEQLSAILSRGTLRFDLETGLVWVVEPDSGGRVVARYDAEPPSDGTAIAEPLPEPLIRRLVQAASASRPLAVMSDGGGGDPPVFFGAAIRVDGKPRGTLAFLGRRSRVTRFTATDKDLLGLMAQWIATEIERRDRMLATPPGTSLTARALRPLQPRRRNDLNALLRRVEPRLRRRVGTDAALDFDLDESLPPVRPARVAMPTLVESLVEAAASLAPSGRIRIETHVPPADAAGTLPYAGDVTLSVVVEGEAVDAAALERAFHSGDVTPAGASHVLPLSQLEPLLRRSGGDLSVAVEPGRRATLTAFLPADPAPAAIVASGDGPSDGPEVGAEGEVDEPHPERRSETAAAEDAQSSR